LITLVSLTLPSIQQPSECTIPNTADTVKDHPLSYTDPESPKSSSSGSSVNSKDTLQLYGKEKFGELVSSDNDRKFTTKTRNWVRTSEPTGFDAAAPSSVQSTLGSHSTQPGTLTSAYDSGVPVSFPIDCSPALPTMQLLPTDKRRSKPGYHRASVACGKQQARASAFAERLGINPIICRTLPTEKDKMSYCQQ